MIVLDIRDRDAVFDKIVNLFLAKGAGLLMFGNGRLQPAMTNGIPNGPRPDLVARAAERGEMAPLSPGGLGPGAHSISCVPIRNCQEEIHAVAQRVDKRGTPFRSADGHAFKDYPVPLG